VEVETSVVGVEGELVGECRTLLQIVSLQVEHEDQVRWKFDSDVGYTISVRFVYCD